MLPVIFDWMSEDTVGPGNGPRCFFFCIIAIIASPCEELDIAHARKCLTVRRSACSKHDGGKDRRADGRGGAHRLEGSPPERGLPL